MDRYGSTKMAKNFLPSKTTNSELRYYAFSETTLRKNGPFWAASMPIIYKGLK